MANIDRKNILVLTEEVKQCSKCHCDCHCESELHTPSDVDVMNVPVMLVKMRSK